MPFDTKTARAQRVRFSQAQILVSFNGSTVSIPLGVTDKVKGTIVDTLNLEIEVFDRTFQFQADHIEMENGDIVLRPRDDITDVCGFLNRLRELAADVKGELADVNGPLPASWVETRRNLINSRRNGAMANIASVLSGLLAATYYGWRLDNPAAYLLALMMVFLVIYGMYRWSTAKYERAELDAMLSKTT